VRSNDVAAHRVGRHLVESGRRRSWSALGARTSASAALREIETVQLGMKLIEGQLVAAADLGAVDKRRAVQ
jgi:hypothetical protein